MSTRGRPKSTAQAHCFPNGKCRFCGYSTKGGTSRELDHILKCSSAPETAKTAVLKEREGTGGPRNVLQFMAVDIDEPIAVSTPSRPISTSTSRPSGFSSPIPEKRMRLPSSSSQSSLGSFVKRMEKESLEEAQIRLARAIFVTGSSLSLVENPYWIDFFKSLNPAFTSHEHVPSL